MWMMLTIMQFMQALDLICDLVMDKLRDPVVFSVCQATFVSLAIYLKAYSGLNHGLCFGIQYEH